MLSQRVAIGSAWSPLRHPTFSRLWLASLTSYLAVWMQSVAGAWLMTSLTRSALLVALSCPCCGTGGMNYMLDRRLESELYQLERELAERAARLGELSRQAIAR